MALKNLKSLFIVEEENDSVKNEEQTKKEDISSDSRFSNKSDSGITWSSSKNKSDNVIPENETGETVAEKKIVGEFNEQIFDSLTKAVANSNLPGEDYLEFVQALKAMKDLPMEDNLKIQTIFATLSVKGLTVQKVLESADYYISVLENEKRKFYTALEEKGKGDINSKRKQISDLEKVSKAKAEQISALTEEINQNHARMQKLKNDITESENKLTATEKSFLVTYEKVVGQINNNIKKVKTVKGAE